MIYNRSMEVLERRTTKYVTDIKRTLRAVGHATNTQILDALREAYPSISATTVHRITQRLYEDGVIGKAPKAADGSARYDATPEPHDHFICVPCDSVRDISVPVTFRTMLQCKLDGCSIAGPLTVSGACRSCKEQLHRIA